MAVQSAANPGSAEALVPQPVVPQDVVVEIDGDNNGIIYAGNQFRTYVGSVAGDLVTLVTDANIPLAQPRNRPVEVRPRDFSGLIGRTSSIQRAQVALESGQPVQFHGEQGIGKTSLIQYLAWRLPDRQDGVLHLRAGDRPLGDLLEKIFAGFFTSQFPVKHYRDQLLEYLRPLDAFILIDDLQIDPDDINELLDTLPSSAFLVAAVDRVMWGTGQAVGLQGLSSDESLALFSRELGRELTGSERERVRGICDDLGGVPLAIVQAAAAYEDDDNAALVGLPRPVSTEAVVRQLVQNAPATEQQVLGVLAALGGTPVLPVNVAGAQNMQGATATLTALEDKGLAEQTSDGRYRLAGGIPTLGSLAGLDAVREQLLSYFDAWGRANHANPALVGREEEALRVLMDWAVENGRHADAVSMARVLDSPLMLEGQWETADRVLAQALDSARAANLPHDEAWALHQQGTRAMLRLDAETSRPLLEEALRIRSELGEPINSQLTQYHLDLWRYLFTPVVTPAPTPPRPNGLGGLGRIWPIAIVLLAALGVLGYLLLGPFSPFAEGATVDGGIPPAEDLTLLQDEENLEDENGGPPTLSTLTARIVSPAAGAILSPGTDVWFAAELDEIDFASFDGDVIWRLDDRVLRNGADFTLPISGALESGDHTLSVEVIGADGLTSRADIPVRVDRLPELTIIRRSGDVQVAPGSAVLFEGRAIDREDGNLSDNIYWESSRDEQIGQGRFVEYVPSEGEHLMTVWVEDSAGNYVESTFSLTVAAAIEDTAPVIRILSPVDNAVAGPNAPIRFAATARDAPDGDISGNIEWIFDDGTRQRGPDISRVLTTGRHPVSARVTDSSGQETIVSVMIIVAEDQPPTATSSPVPPTATSAPNTPTATSQPASPPAPQLPLVQIIEARVADPNANGALVFLGATADDAEDGDLSGVVVWRSSLVEQPLGRGPLLQIQLPPGEHVISATVTDSSGATTVVEQPLLVEAQVRPNTLPTLTLFSPAPGIILTQGDLVTLEAEALDEEDGNLGDLIIWSSSLDGQLGSGPFVATSDLSPGLHTIAAAVTDLDGGRATAEVEITVETVEPDLVASITQLADAINLDGGEVLIPVQIRIANLGSTPAEPFKIAAYYASEGATGVAALEDMPGISGPYVFTEADLEAGGILNLEGFVRVSSPIELGGQTVALWITADSCEGEEFSAPACRVVESNEDNNNASRISIAVP